MGQTNSHSPHREELSAAAPSAPPVTRLTSESVSQLAKEAAAAQPLEEASESFASWRSAGSGARSRASSDQTRDSLGSVTPMSQTRQSWQLDQRPSADTPLPSNAGGAPGGGSVYNKGGGSRTSCSSELLRPSSDSRCGGGAADPGARPSCDDGTASVYSAAGSGRSSFALERASLEANRASLEAFQEAFASAGMRPGSRTGAAARPQPGSAAGGAGPAAEPPVAVPGPALDQLLAAAHLPGSLREKFARLCVLPPNTPAPASMLARLWGAEGAEVRAALAALAAAGVLNTAQLPDGRVWCLPQAQQLAAVQAACRDAAPRYHRMLLDAYAEAALPAISEESGGSADADAMDASGAPCAAAASLGSEGSEGDVAAAPPGQYHWQPQAPDAQAGAAATVSAAAAAAAPSLAARLREAPDDGYLLANLGHHLAGAGRAAVLRQLLLDPAWLRRKLLAAGLTAVVADFRRYLLAHNCADTKLVLEALQLSAAQALAHPRAHGLLRCLMACRLATAPLSPAMQAWLAEQRRLVYEDSRRALLGGLPRCLAPLSPSLEQAGGLQRLALRGHTAPVTKVLLTPSGTDAVTASSDGTCRVWDLDIGDCVLLLEGHSGPVADMAITSDGSLALTCSSDGTARAFEMERGQCLRVLAGHTAAVNALAMDPWARFVVTASSDGTARVWDLSSARTVHTLKAGCREQGGVLAVALSPCTRFAILGCADGAARMYDVISGQCMGVMGGAAGWVTAARFLPDGKSALTAGHDGVVRLWDLHTGSCRFELAGHEGRINALAVSPDATWCATGSEDGTARVWDLQAGQCRRVLTGHKAWVSDVCISPSGDKLVTTSGDGTALAYSAESGDLLRLLEGHSGPVHACVVTRKGRFAVTVSEDAGVRVWDLAARLAQPRGYHEGRVYCVTGAPAGSVLATCGEDCDARLWDARSGTFKGLLHRHKVPIRWAAFSADGRRLVTASPDRCVLLWDVTSLDMLRALPVSEGSRIRSFAAAADLRRAVVCKWDSTVVVHDLESGQRLATLQRWGERDSATGHTSAVNQVLMTPDGATVVTASKDCTARVWDAATGACLHVLEGHSDSVLGGAICASARLLATFAFDDSLFLWCLDSGRRLAAVKLPDTAQHVALSPDGRRVAVALANASLCVFDAGSGDAGRPWEFHTADVTGLQFTADGSELISTSLDACACVWDAATGAHTGLFVGDCGLTCCWYDAVLQQVAVGTDRGLVHSLDLGLTPRAMPAAALAAPVHLPAAEPADQAAEGTPGAQHQPQPRHGGGGADAAPGALAGSDVQEPQPPASPAEMDVDAVLARSRSPSPAQPAGQ